MLIGDLAIPPASAEAIQAAPAPRRLRLMRSLAVIGGHLHDIFAGPGPFEGSDVSRRSCILASLAVRDFLIGAGFRNARVMPVAVLIRADQAGREIHSLCIGHPDGRSTSHSWNGHLVACLPRERLILDTTLYQARRPAWPSMPGMMAACAGGRPGTMDAGRRKPIFGLRPVTALTMVRPAAAPVTARNGDGGGDAETRLSIAWLANPSNLEWRNAPDADPGRRAFVVNRMLEILEGPGKTIEQDPQSDADSEGTPACP